jgi:cytochrome c553
MRRRPLPLSTARALVLGAAVLGAAAGVAAPAAVADRLEVRLAACTTCHGREGRAAPDGYHPRIAGKPAGYLLHQLQNFRDGRRHYGPMVALLEPLPDPYLQEIAAYFAALELPYPPPPRSDAPRATLERGRRLALEGDTSRQLPACAACHGVALTGRLPATPGLLGLPRDYLAAQLGAWQAGERRARAPDCMAEVVRRLGPGDAAAVSAWLAAQPVPQPVRIEAPAAAAPSPLRCGAAEAEAGR